MRTRRKRNPRQLSNKRRHLTTLDQCKAHPSRARSNANLRENVPRRAWHDIQCKAHRKWDAHAYKCVEPGSKLPVGMETHTYMGETVGSCALVSAIGGGAARVLLRVCGSVHEGRGRGESPDAGVPIIADAHGATYNLKFSKDQAERARRDAAGSCKSDGLATHTQCNGDGGEVVNGGQASSWRRSRGAAVRGRRMVCEGWVYLCDKRIE
jgi:hypothetical protein